MVSVAARRHAEDQPAVAEVAVECEKRWDRPSGPDDPDAPLNQTAEVCLG